MTNRGAMYGMLWNLTWPASGGNHDGVTWREANPVTYMVEIAPPEQGMHHTCVHCGDVPATHDIVFFGLDEGEAGVCLDCAGDMVFAGQVMYTIPWTTPGLQRLRGDGLPWRDPGPDVV